MRNIHIPKSNSGDQETISIEKNLIIVGANGSGKTRYGSRIEQVNNPTKRISAQRVLQLTEAVAKQDFEEALSNFLQSYKNQSPVTPQNDYQQLMTSIFSEESKRDSDYVKEARKSSSKPPILDSVIDKILKVWDEVLPHRKLVLDNYKVRAREVEDSSIPYSGAEMSDGEKVGLYLIAQTLLAENNCILIIDEPELHLHKALMVRLWNKLEECRSDCTFVYITHDLDFAASKPSSKLFWIQSYKNNIWDWKELDGNEVIPDNLFLEILGSRKPILFVEGDKGSLDIQLYQAFYDNLTVIPCGSCEKVIEAVRGLRNHSYLHDKKVYGLIDRDFRNEEQLNSLKEDGIFSSTLNEIENIFLVPEIIKLVCEHLSKVDKNEEIISKIKSIYTDNKTNLSFAASKYKMHRHLGEKFGIVKDQDTYSDFKNSIFSDLDQMFYIELPDNEADITAILKAYPHKGLVNSIQGILELSKNGYKNLVLSFLSSDKRSNVIESFSKYLPDTNN